MDSEILDDDISERLFFPFSSLDKVIEVVDIGLVMLRVVVVKGFLRDNIGEGSLGIG